MGIRVMRRWWLVVSGMLIASCGFDGLSLHEAAPEEDRFQAIQRRLPISILPGPSGFEGDSGCDPEGCDPAAFSEAIARGCYERVVGNSLNACDDKRVVAESWVCTANTLLEIVDSASQREVTLDFPFTGSGGGSGIVNVPPQDAESNTELARLALEAAANALRVTADAFDITRTPNCTDVVLRDIDPVTGTPYASRLAYVYAEAVEITYAATERMSLASAAVSDSAYSRLADNADASAFVTAKFASRTAAAHMLVGGELGLPGLAAVAEDGFFSRTSLSGEGQRALQWFRAAAVNPNLVGDDSLTAPTTDELVAGGGAVAEVESLRFRLGLMQSRELLQYATDPEGVYTLLGVTKTGFAEAREHLREELRAFDRSDAVELDAEELPDGSTTTSQGIVLYAATRVPPRQLLPSFWAAVLRFDPTPNPALTGYSTFTMPPAWVLVPDAADAGNLPPGDTWGAEVDATVTDPMVSGRQSMASVVDGIHRRGGDILARLCPAGVCDTTFGSSSQTIVGASSDLAPSPTLDVTVTGGATEAPTYDNAAYVGRARACWWNPSSGGLYDVRIDLDSEIDDELLVVRGRDGLECAVRGELEGIACDATLFASLQPATGGWSGTAADVRTVRVLGEEVGNRPQQDTISLFVVQRRSGESGPPAPGQYLELTGFVLPKPIGSAPGYEYCTGSAIAPRQEAEAAALIEPSPTAPFRAATSCAGLPSDLRIPLENELTSDGQPLESSWRHYLQLATRASAEADALGEDLVRTGLEMDLRSEAATDELSRLCGISISLSSIAGELDAGSTPAVAPGGPPCTVPYVDQEGSCVLDPVLHAATRSVRSEDWARLASCVGADLVPWATLGSSVICAWDLDPATPGGVCEGSNPRSLPCPYLASDGTCAGSMPPGATALVIDERIGLFDQPVHPPPAPPDMSNAPCDALARVRAGLGLDSDASALRNFLTYENLSRHGRQMNWEAQAGDYSRVRYGGAIVLRTGSLVDGPSPSWPAGTTMPTGAACPTIHVNDPLGYEGPLFCLRDVPLTDRRTRSRVNNLLARATMAARLMTGNGLEGMVLPYYASNDADLYTAHTENFDWTPISVASGTPPAEFAWAGEFRIDHHTTGDEAEEYVRYVADFGSRASQVDGVPGTLGSGCTAVPDAAEWSHCPYDGLGNCIVFDDGPDCDDSAIDDQDVPLILAPAGPGLELDAAARNARNFWERDDARALFERASERTTGELHGSPGVAMNQLTYLFNDWESSCDHQTYEDCIDRGAERMQREGNLAFIGGSHLTYNDLLNGMELMCVGVRQGLPVTDTSCDQPANILDLGDAHRMAGYLECRANELSAFGANSIVQNLPRRVLDALRSDGFGSYGSGAGELDAQVSEIRAALIELGTLRTGSAADMRALASRTRSLQSAVSRHERAREIELLMSFGRRLDRITNCATAAATIGSVDPVAAGGRAGAAVAVCVNSIAQVLLDIRLADLRDANIDDALIDEYARFEGEMAQFGRRASERAASTRAALERIDGSLTRVRVTQTRARRALSRALLLEDDGMQAHFAVDTVYRARYSTLLARYRRSHMRAVRAAAIARIALEQRLGMPLADMSDDVFSDEPPRRWVDTICTLPSIDYDRLRMSTPDESGDREGDGALVAPDGYSGTFVGDYVRRLEDVFESYSFVHPFRDGGDTAVISLRDDVFGTLAECDVPSSNLLFNGGRLDRFENAERPGWSIAGCDPSAVGGTGIVNRQCVSIEPIDDTSDMPEGDVDTSREGLPMPYRVSYGGSAASTIDARLEQALLLGPGRYRLSWIARDNMDGIAPANAFAIWDDVDAPTITGSVYDEAVPDSTWRRYWFFFDVPSEQTLRVVAAHGTSPATPRSIEVAGVMVENVTDSVIGDPDRGIAIELGGIITEDLYGRRAAPPPFSEAGDLGLTERRACRDETGQWFRAEGWVPGCVRTCADGYDGNCPPEWSESRCYREISFDVSSDTLQQQLVDGDAGFAAGNYNYRIESIGVNLVGTGLRDCEGAGSGSSGCFGSGSVSYTLLHQGDFLVRNAVGSLYNAPIFPGRIESARALAAERYITNPISSADRALIEPYLRDEFQGRPMGGTLVLRVWDDPRFAFKRLEDVQILLNYRYWQHQR